MELNLAGDLKQLEHLAVSIRRFCEEHALGEDVDFRLNLVLEELFTNSVRHGGCKGMALAASVQLRREDRDVLVEYADRGQPFDPEDAPPPDLADRKSVV